MCLNTSSSGLEVVTESETTSPPGTIARKRKIQTEFMKQMFSRYWTLGDKGEWALRDRKLTM